MKLFDPKDVHKKFVGTPDYLAPETINGSGQDDMVDWWSLGVIMFEFLYGYPPFHALTPDLVFQNILNRRIDWPTVTEEIDLDISDAAKTMMESLMVLSPGTRLGSQNGAMDVKSQKFFEAVIWDRISEEEALFVPTPDHPEDTDYFDARGATNHVFEDESDTQLSSDGSPIVNDKGKTDAQAFCNATIHPATCQRPQTSQPTAE
ncbi:putative Serine threonine protein kinase [Taphrina deformans PYCC 5710]|uniref:non-specific serine/threonine protein kinase n=1 Tax=Taphrina deformans (strain PYCC 5710 / ATCC 11124 / CBS 356.35 / IMI 108563 / JCM 9778 / NBRC 8474) TaxID=1097556 RepID=R4XC49_TAPDE|nr:putative Serine threonine protein kinase [Taphrina deformans PYCC 5710]|eukprot:CCG83452.1 putative Serine threonine protein kinase [Taphrina deformans PYCC 5710]